METIGLIAGRGNFPILFASEARKAGYGIVAVCIKSNTRRCIRRYVNKEYWLSAAEFNRMVDIFKHDGVRKVAMAGQINPYFLFNPKIMSYPDVKDFFGKIQDRRADTIFRAFSNKLESAGLELLDSTSFLSSYMPGEGVLTKRNPSQEEDKDIELGIKIAKHLGSMDIGQSVCVRNGVILAVEAIEGTDNAIRRAAALSRSSVVLVKAAKPSQDMRFDVPAVGLVTIKNLPGGSCLAIEAGKTLFFDLKEAVGLADRKNIAILSIQAKDFS